MADVVSDAGSAAVAAVAAVASDAMARFSARRLFVVARGAGTRCDATERFARELADRWEGAAEEWLEALARLPRERRRPEPAGSRDRTAGDRAASGFERSAEGAGGIGAPPEARGMEGRPRGDGPAGESARRALRAGSAAGIDPGALRGGPARARVGALAPGGGRASIEADDTPAREEPAGARGAVRDRDGTRAQSRAQADSPPAPRARAPLASPDDRWTPHDGFARRAPGGTVPANAGERSPDELRALIEEGERRARARAEWEATEF